MRALVLRFIPALGLTLLLASPAAAQPSESSDQIARAHFQAATGYFDTGDYESALREFERAYALTQYAQLLYNLYACHERLGQLQPAITRLEQYLAASPDAPNRAALEERLVNLRRRLDAQRSGATAQQSEDPPPTLMTHPETGEPVVEAGTPQQDTTDVVDPDASESTDSGSGHGPAIAMFSVAGAGLVTFAVAGLMTRSEDDALAGSCGRDGPRDCTDAEVRGLRRRSITADVGLSVGVVSGVIGLVLLLVQGDDEPSERDVAVQADVRPGGASVMVGGRF